MPLVQHSHLIAWSHTGGENQFGELIRRLIYATVCRTRPQVDFLSGQTNNLSGWDGVVGIQQPTWFHQSLWEISVRDDYVKKMHEDYEEAIKKPLPSGWDAKDVFYVAATLRHKVTKGKKANIAKDLVQKYGNRFGTIVILDVDSFVQWIEKVPAVESWAAEVLHIGKGRFGRSLEHEWNTWSVETLPATSIDLVAAGRDLTRLRSELIQSRPGIVEVQADSVKEAVGIVYGALSLPLDGESAAGLASALVIQDSNNAVDFSIEPVPQDSTPLTILHPAAALHRNSLVKQGHRVVVVNGHSARGDAALTFDRPSVDAFRSALVQMSMEESEAEKEARACGCSVSVWHIRKVFESNRTKELLPVWAQPQYADTIVPAVFLGGWDEASAPDGELIKILSSVAPLDFFAALQQHSICDDPLFEVVETERILVAPTAAFAFVASYITASHLLCLKDACSKVFGTISPEVSARWEKKPSELRMRKREEEWSGWVLDGLAATLLRIAVLDGPLLRSGALSSYGGTGQAYVDQLIKNLPGLSSDPRVMASLSQRLPYLAEASPTSFMEALDSLLQGDLHDMQLWLGDDDSIFGQTFHTGVLWALELLAWSETYLPHASLLLARLAVVDPGGRLSNRPANSLREIFLPWIRHTSASLEARVAVLTQLLDQVPAIGWSLLVDLLPRVHQTAVPTQKPRWRDFGQAGAELTYAEIREAYQRYISLALDVSRMQPRRLADMAGHYENLSQEHRCQLENQLMEVVNDSDEVKLAIWDALHRLIVRHKSFAGAEWALAEADIACLEEVANRFVVADPVARCKWLFDDQLPETGHPSSDFTGWEQDVQEKRINAIGVTYDAGSTPGLDRLIEIVAYPALVGDTLARLPLDRPAFLAVVAHWLSLNTPRSLIAAQMASATRFSRDGKAWTDDVLMQARSMQWTPQHIAVLLLGYPDSFELFELISHLGNAVEREYWTKRYGFIRLDPTDVRTFALAVDHLVECRRVVEVINMNWPRLKSLGYQKVLGLVDALLEQLSIEKLSRALGTLAHGVQELFTWLRQQPNAAPTDIARREYSLLPLLAGIGRHERGGEDLSLHRLMQEDASFYVDVLCDLYQPATRRESESTDAKADQGRAHAAYDLLHTFALLPGVRGDRLESESELNDWVDRVRSIAANRDRKAVADQYIGKILFHIPLSPDDQVWPNPAVRRILERLASSEIERGISLEEFNSIGVTSRGLFDGGTQERDRENRYRRNATLLGKHWPRAQHLCIAIADNWRRQSEHEDNEVKKLKSEIRR